MAFMFDDDQLALQSTVRRYLTDKFPVDQVGKLADSDAGWDPQTWNDLADLGWIGVAVPEEHGGVGLGFLELAIVLEETGRALYPGPYFSTTVLAMPALGPLELVEACEGRVRWSAEIDGLVTDLGLVDRVVTTRGAVPAVGEVLATTDGTRRLGRLTPGGQSLPCGALDYVRILAGAAVEAVGVASRALELAVAYAGDRQQFGRRIGEFQGIAHSLADAYTDLELARSLAYWAAWCIDNDPDQAATAATAAKSHVTDMAVDVCERAIQVLGGIAFTWEHPLHRYYKRALALQCFAGHPSMHRSRLAAMLLDQATAVKPL